MAKKSGLGRGLGALLGDISSEAEQIQMVGLEELIAREDQPRQSFDNDSLEELSNSIKEHGIIQPLLVRKVDKGYEIIAGERRYRASKIAGLTTLPVIVKEVEDRVVSELSIIENIQRENLNPVEEGLAYKTLMENYGLTQQDLAEKLGKSRSYVANSMRLLNLDENTLGQLKLGNITSSQARTLLSIASPNDRKKALEKLLSGKANVRELENISRGTKKDKNKESSIFVKDIEEKLTERFATNVKLSDSKKGGKIEIKYYNYEDLERILDIIGGIK